MRAAVNAAATGDTILISPGTYDGGVFVTGRNLTIASLFLTTGDPSYIAQTTLSGVVGDVCAGDPECRGDAVIEFSGSAGGAVVGLTVTGGDKGVRSAASVDVTSCRVIANSDGLNYTSGSGGVIRDSLFTLNHDDGIDLNARVHMQIIGNDIVDNRDDGVEFRLYPYSGALEHIDFLDNTISGNGEDGIQLIDYSDASSREVRIEGNIFRANAMAAVGCMSDGNTVEDYSGSPMAERVLVIGNTFVNAYHGVVGGANTVMLNNIFTGSTGPAVRRVSGGSIVSHTLFWGNAVDAEESNLDGSHTTTADPLLDADASLLPGSPAIDQGTARFVWSGQTVLDLSPTDYIGTAPDLGAREFDSGAPRAGPDAAGVEEGGRLEVAAPGLLANDAAPGGGALTVVGAFVPPVHGDLRLGTDGSWDYLHDGSETGSDSFVYEVADPNDQRARATVTLTILPVDDSPVASADSFLVDLDSTANPLDVLANDTDPDAGDGPVLISVDPSGTQGGVAVSGRVASYTPPPGFTGNDSFGYTIRDAAGATATGRAFVSVQDIDVLEVMRRVAAGGDDAEETPAGKVALTSSDLELTLDTVTQTVGIRFADLQAPREAQILSAWIQFQVDEATSDAADLILRAQASDDAATFTTATGNISSRPVTAASAAWSPPAWPTVGAAGAAQATPDLSSLVSEVIHRPGWAPGHAMAFVITGTGHRVAEAWDGVPSAAPLLHVRYVIPPPPPANAAPLVSAGADAALGEPGSLMLSATVQDDGLPDPPCRTTLAWAQVSGPASVAFVNPGSAQTSATFPMAGTYVLELRASDGDLQASDSLQVVVGSRQTGKRRAERVEE